MSCLRLQKWHVLVVSRSGSEFFSKSRPLLIEHLHEIIETPVIIYRAIVSLPFIMLFEVLALFSSDVYLLLGKIANHHSLFSQSMCNEMRGFFVQAVLLFFSTLLLGDPLVKVGDMYVPAGLLLAPNPFRADLVKLLVMPSVALETTDAVEAFPVVHPCC